MINVYLCLTNPWSKGTFKNLWHKGGTLPGKKAWEVEVCYFPVTLFELLLRWSVHTDHAGPKVEIVIFGWSFSAQIYDTRHWSFVSGTWELYERE